MRKGCDFSDMAQGFAGGLAGAAGRAGQSGDGQALPRHGRLGDSLGR
ncbi:hypothetical protein [Gemmobacter aquatilis]|nr:hypothetical protein [Gemmobacter aquatilis]